MALAGVESVGESGELYHLEVWRAETWRCWAKPLSKSASATSDLSVGHLMHDPIDADAVGAGRGAAMPDEVMN